MAQPRKGAASGRKETGLIRLLALADFLECDVAAAEKRSGRKKLEMERWFNRGDTALTRPSLEPEGCGTSACALGWATVAFPDSGLKVKTAKCSGRCGDIFCSFSNVQITLNDARDLKAAHRFFSLRGNEAAQLFTARAGYSVADVVHTFREFVAKQWEADDGR